MLVALGSGLASPLPSEKLSFVTNLALEGHMDYVVYGMVRTESTQSVLVRDQSFAWLMVVPLELFEIIDPSRPDTWVVAQAGGQTLTGPREFCEEPGFLDYLADGDVGAQRVFARWRADYADYSPAEGRELMGQLGSGLRSGEISDLDLTPADLGFAYAHGWLDPRQAIEISAYIYREDSDGRIGELMSIEFANTRRAVEILEASVPLLVSASAHRRAWVRVLSQVAGTRR